MISRSTIGAAAFAFAVAATSPCVVGAKGPAGGRGLRRSRGDGGGSAAVAAPRESIEEGAAAVEVEGNEEESGETSVVSLERWHRRQDQRGADSGGRHVDYDDEKEPIHKPWTAENSAKVPDDKAPPAAAAMPEKRIVGGDDADAGEFPFYASIRGLKKSGNNCRGEDSDDCWLGCGGSLIGKCMVLTAAHCCEEPERMTRVRVGLYCDEDDNCDVPYESSRIAKVEKHPDYGQVPGGSMPLYDICLVHLEDCVTTIEPVPIDVHNDHVYENTPHFQDLCAMGMGKTSGAKTFFRSSFPDTLQKVHLANLPHEYCEDEYPENYHRGNMMCAGEYDNKSTCGGDSGGPLILPRGPDGKPNQVGVVSWGKSKCKGGPDSPSVFATVRESAGFIATTTCNSCQYKEDQPDFCRVCDDYNGERPGWCSDVHPVPSAEDENEDEDEDATTTTVPTTTSEASTTTPEPSTTTPEPTTSTPEPTTSTPEPTTSTPEPTTSTPEASDSEEEEESTSTPEPSTSTPEPTTSTPEAPDSEEEEDQRAGATPSGKPVWSEGESMGNNGELSAESANANAKANAEAKAKANTPDPNKAACQAERSQKHCTFGGGMDFCTCGWLADCEPQDRRDRCKHNGVPEACPLTCQGACSVPADSSNTGL